MGDMAKVQPSDVKDGPQRHWMRRVRAYEGAERVARKRAHVRVPSDGCRQLVVQCERGCRLARGRSPPFLHATVNMRKSRFLVIRHVFLDATRVTCNH